MLDNYKIGVSALTGNIYLGKINKKGTEWLEKKDITMEFDIIAIDRYLEPKTIRTNEGSYLLCLFKLKNKAKTKEEALQEVYELIEKLYNKEKNINEIYKKVCEEE